ncbi:ladderlectin-like [Poeciliopsis prolifica]|uniref:ladderlectin-like n=1 Tax=Poeciliopsis prolifica TaxID=188132 RepID=UPI0024145222|nr:ladderlectin-like [Poeciliopsis prolifica]
MKLSAVFLMVFSMMALTSGFQYHICSYRPFYFPRVKLCPPGWTKIRGRCFLYVARARTWADAEKIVVHFFVEKCLSMGANLASVRNAYEYRWVQALIRARSRRSGETWLGGSDAQQERTWLWSDGTPMRYTNWCRGQPDNARRSQHCLQMNWSGRKCWDDLWCNYKRPSVCMKKL